MNRSKDWFHQAAADLAQAQLSAEAGHHEWACFACHQAVEKALKAIHLQQGQQIWPTMSLIWKTGCGCWMLFTSRPVTPIAF